AHLLNPARVTEKDHVRGCEGLHAVARHYRRFGKIGGKSGAALERILDRCGRKGTRVILIGPALSRAHRESLAPVQEAYLGYIRDLQSRYGVAFVDCSALLPDSLMKDHHHLKVPEGVMAFTHCLSHDLLPPLLKSSPEPSTPIRLVNRERAP